MAGLRIFETDPDAKPKPRSEFQSDVVGRFRSGRQTDGRPESLSEWRVTTGDPLVAAAISGMMGGHPEEWETPREDALEILTNTAKVDILIDSAESISATMVLWGMGGEKVHECDGKYLITDDDDNGTICGCPALLAERKEKAKKGRGPKPSISMKFRLADDPKLGYFRFQSASWDLTRVLHEVQEALDNVGTVALATLSLEVVEFTPKNGPMAGRLVSYRKPVIDVKGPAEEDTDTGAIVDNVPF